MKTRHGRVASCRATLGIDMLQFDRKGSSSCLALSCDEEALEHSNTITSACLIWLWSYFVHEGFNTCYSWCVTMLSWYQFNSTHKVLPALLLAKQKPVCYSCSSVSSRSWHAGKTVDHQNQKFLIDMINLA